MKAKHALLWLCALLSGGRVLAVLPGEVPVIESISIEGPHLNIAATFPAGIASAALEMKPTLGDQWQSTDPLDIPSSGGTVEFVIPRPDSASTFFRLNVTWNLWETDVLLNSGKNRFLPSGVDFSSARIVNRNGRDLVTM